MKDAGFYVAKAVALLLLLMVVGKLGPDFPSFVFPLVFLLYALVSTMGALYSVVVRRAHKQEMLSEEGQLSRYNRKWTLWTIGLFLFSCASALLFTINAPRWSMSQWVLIWVSAFAYYIVFLLADRKARNLYRAGYHKAKAMRWSVAITVVALCAAYAVVAFVSFPIDQGFAAKALSDMHGPYENSWSALMCDLDKLSMLSDGLMNAFVGQVASRSFIIAAFIEIVVTVSVFLGLANLFAFCLLTCEELKSEYHLLPVKGCDEVSGCSLAKWYGALVGGTWLVLAILFLGFEFETSKIRASEAQTPIDSFVEQESKLISLMLDPGIDEVISDAREVELLKEINADFLKKYEALAQEREAGIAALIDEYYDQCLKGMESYLDWCEGPWGWIAMHMGSKGKDMAIEAFNNEMMSQVDGTELQFESDDYNAELSRLDDEYRTKVHSAMPDLPDALDFKSTSIEWSVLGIDKESRVLDEILDTDADRQARKESVRKLIEEARQDAHASLEGVRSGCVTDEDSSAISNAMIRGMLTS